MFLEPGVRLGPYEISSALGAGGMGEVYRARDTRLERSVAIKVLPAEVAADPERRARFEREARAVAALSHPHICVVHDVGRDNGIDYLVMELLDGETLADRLVRAKGPLQLDQVLKIGREIADALDRAHRAGIVHRDLKPANVMLTKSGAKLLDFGLAKKRETVVAGSLADLTTQATAPGTAAGTLLGTVHYMAPEQVEGREADARSDIWALGVVLYEMATGTRPFDGASAASLLGAILKDTPAPLSTRQPLTPPAFEHLVDRCLDKDPDERWQSASDIRHELTWAGRGPRSPVQSPTPASGQSLHSRVIPWLAAGALATALALTLPAWWTHRTEPAPALMQLSTVSARGTTFSSPPASVVAPQIALSPDGRYLVFVAEAPKGRPALWLRALRNDKAEPLRGTEDAIYPFWSADSTAIGFFAQGKLRIVGLAGEPPRTLSDSPLDTRGGSWSANGTIVFAPEANSGLFKISAAGGTPTPATTLDVRRKENSHRFPSFLPDGRHFLYTTRSPNQEDWGVSMASLDDPVGKPLIMRTEWAAQYAAPGYMLFRRGGALMAQPFDATRLQFNGEPLAIAPDVGSTTTGYAAFSASQVGVIAHAPNLSAPGQLRWFDRRGNQLEVVGDPAEYLDFELSPDNQKVAVSRVPDPASTNADIWLVDLARHVQTRQTTDAQNDASVLWSPDGNRIVFRSNRAGIAWLYEKRSAGTEQERVVLNTGTSLIPSDWSADSKTILFTTTSPAGGFEIFAWSRAESTSPQAVVHTSLNAMHGRFSPDGKWLAYASDESGQLQVYVQPYPGTGEQRQISGDGGAEPRWRKDGTELYFLSSSGRLMAVPVPHGNAFEAGVPQPLFDVRVPLAGNPYRSNYAVNTDGSRFLVNTRVDDASTPINLILNWPALVRR